MSFYYPPWENALEPNQINVRSWLDNLYSKFQPIEQARWNQSNIDTLFYAGSQTFVNRYFNFAPTSGYQQFYFNLLQQPVNLVTGYQRQNRKSVIFTESDGGDSQTCDQYTKIIMKASNKGGINEVFSKACELSAISGLVLLQPYLDFSNSDPAQGELKLKVWEYNSFLCDPYFRESNMEDAQYVWCQEYISKKEAEDRFPDKVQNIAPMAGTPQRYGSFYFLPENYNMARNDLMVLSYVWYKWKRKKKVFYSKSTNQFIEYSEKNTNPDQILYNIPDLEIVEIEVPTWKLAVVLNDQLMYQGDNPLGFDDCPFIPVFWNYEPHQNYYDLRARSLVKTMRDAQFLLNRRIVINHDITEATINAGWKRKVGAVANEDNLKKSGQGYDVLVNEGYEMTDVEKIQASGVPESDLALAEQLNQLIFSVSGINMENWSAQEDKQASGLTVMLKQAANLMVLQKYFDQWDYSLKLVGNVLLKIVLNNWNAAKVALMIGEEPTPLFYSGIFSKYHVLAEEGLNTPSQRAMQAKQLLDINEMFGREVFPPSMIVDRMSLTGKAEAMEFLQNQEQQAAAQQEHMQTAQDVLEQAKIKELYSKATANIARAREDHSRSESNLGLYEERLSMIERNRALSLKEKQAALTGLLDNIQRFGEIEVDHKQNQLEGQNFQQMILEEKEKRDVEARTGANKFLAEIMGLNGSGGDQEGL